MPGVAKRSPDLRAVRTHPPQLHQTHRLRWKRDPHKQRLEQMRKGPPKFRDRVVIRVSVGHYLAKGRRIVSGLLRFVARKHPVA